MNRSKLARILVSSMSVALILAGTAGADLTDGLVSYWPLDGNFIDAVGANDGQFMGTAPQTFDDGQFGQGIVLDGINQFIEIQGDESQFDFVDQDFSISAWFRVDAFTKDWQALIAKGEGNRWRVHRRGAENIMTWNGGNADVPADANPPVDDGAIHHFVGVSTADEVLMYMDGELVSIGPAPAVENNSMPVMIGENPDARNRTWAGLIDDVAIWGRALDEVEISSIWNNGDGMSITPPIVDIPPFFVGGENVIGAETYNGKRSNEMYVNLGDPEPGLLQEWYQVANPGSKDGVDQVFADQDPAVEPFRAGHGSSWWSGNQAAFGDLVQYPEEVQPPFVDTGNDNYTVRATGEINIPESGTYRFADGVDDYTYLAIDADKSGVAGDDPSEVLIDDNAWTSVYRDQNNGGQGLGEIDLQVAEGGEWLAIEFNMGEGGGDDAGVVYWDYDLDAPDGQRLGSKEGFPELAADPIDPGDAETMYIPDSHLRSAMRELVSADLVATINIDRAMEFDVNGDTDQADQLIVQNPDPAIFTTILDIDGITFQIKSAGTIASGDAFTILDADQVIGTPIITSVDQTQNWVFDAATGQVCLDLCPGGVLGDFNGDGVLDASDINDLTAKSAANSTDLSYDLNGDNAVDGLDVEQWISSASIFNSYVGDANLDKEFNSSDLVSMLGAGKYESGQAAVWTEGDFTGDGFANSSDLVAGLAGGGYENGPKAAVAAVPEPSSVVLVLLSAMSLIGATRRRIG